MWMVSQWKSIMIDDSFTVALEESKIGPLRRVDW
ncbi:unnamed protein product [Penicillium roqueforti FM164]|uniref:Str. FM013 n=2 Tax=Penicillium TaxID=5073 RepID=A0A0G4PZC2_PENC3|nr:unnamed protein product [Penicillium roqueforti FM164]CRL31510.1 unnamed protein product [Penicillium camemberti]